MPRSLIDYVGQSNQCITLFTSLCCKFWCNNNGVDDNSDDVDDDNDDGDHDDDGDGGGGGGGGGGDGNDNDTNNDYEVIMTIRIWIIMMLLMKTMYASISYIHLNAPL